MSQVPYMRRILLVNKSVQMRLVGYGVFAGIVAGLYTGTLSTLVQRWNGYSGRETPIVLVVGFAVFSLVAILGLIISSQIAGPIYRLHRNIKRMADGEKPEKIHIRRGDAYGDLFEDYNRLVERMESHARK